MTCSGLHTGRFLRPPASDLGPSVFAIHRFDVFFCMREHLRDVLRDKGGPSLQSQVHSRHSFGVAACHKAVCRQRRNADCVACVRPTALRTPPSFRAQEQQQLYPDSIINSREPIGKEHIIKSWTIDDVRAFYDQWYYPGNMCIYVVGNVNPRKTLERITRVFGSAPARHAVRDSVNLGGFNATNFNTLLATPEDPLAFGLPLFDKYPAAALDAHRTPLQLQRTQGAWELPIEPVCGAWAARALQCPERRGGGGGGATVTRMRRRGCQIKTTQARMYGETPHTPPPFWAHSRTLPQGVELLV